MALFNGDAEAPTAVRLLDEALAVVPEQWVPIQRAFTHAASVFPILELGEFDEAIGRAARIVESLA